MSSTEQVAATTSGRRRGRAWLALVAFAVAVFVSASLQWETIRPSWLPWLPALWGIAAVLGGIAWRISSPAVAAVSPERTDDDATPLRRLLAPAVLLAVATFGTALVLLYRDLLSPAGTALWAVGLALWPAALALRERRHAPSPSLRRWPARAALLGVLLLALGARLYQLEDIPAKYLDDEGSVSEWGLNYLHGTPVFGQHMAAAMTLFRNGATAYPLLGSYVHALVMQVAGETVWGSRLTAVIAGVLCVAVLYALLCEQVAAWAALAAALLLAVCDTHLFWSRSGIPQSMTTTTVAAIFWLTLRGLRTGSYATFALAGVLLGLAQYFYEGARFFVPVLALFFAVRAVSERGFLRARGLHVVLMAATAAVVFAPIGIWYMQNPGELLARSRGVLIFAQPDYIASRYPGLDTTGVVVAQLRRALEGFAYRGDGSNFFSLRGPILDPVSRTLLLTGIFAVAAVRDRLRLLVSLWIWVPIGIVCIPTVDPPSMTRLIQVVPALFAVVGLVLDRIGRVVWLAAGRVGAAVCGIGVAAALAYAGEWNMSEFFVRYPQQHGADEQTLGGKLAAAAPREQAIRVVGGPFSVFAPSVRFLARGHATEDLPESAIPLPGRGRRDALVFLPPGAKEQIERMRSTYPGAVEAEHRNARGELMLHSFDISAADLNAAAGDDAAWRVPDGRVGIRGTRDGEFASPRALAVDERGYLYVADTGNRRIVVFDADGEGDFEFGGPGGGGGAAGAPYGLTFLDDGSLAVLRRDPDSLERYRPDGTFIGRIAPAGPVVAPAGIAAAANGFYLLDAGAAQILRLDLDGKVLARAGERGAGPGQFLNPVAIATAADGTVYVFDSGNRRIQRLSQDLVYQSEWPVDLGDERQGQMLAVGPPGDERVYLADPHLGAVRRFTPAGRAEWLVGLKGDYPGNLAWPVAVTVDREGDVFLADENRGQIFRYDLSHAASALTRQK